jgi:hypothetical protein
MLPSGAPISPSPLSNPHKRNKTESKTKRTAPFLRFILTSKKKKKRLADALAASSFPCLRPACLRLGGASATTCKDISAHTPAPSNISLGWDAARETVSHLLLPLFSLSSSPTSSILRGTARRFRCRWRRLNGNGCGVWPRMLGAEEGKRRGGVPLLFVG